MLRIAILFFVLQTLLLCCFCSLPLCFRMLFVLLTLYLFVVFVLYSLLLLFFVLLTQHIKEPSACRFKMPRNVLYADWLIWWLAPSHILQNMSNFQNVAVLKLHHTLVNTSNVKSFYTKTR